MRLTDSKAMRDADNKAIHVLGIPSTMLMTNAARKLAAAALELLGEQRNAVVFCGSGNNGGDGVAAASYLLRRGVDTRCFLTGGRVKMTEDCAEMERRLVELGGTLEDFDPCEAATALESADVIIDAIFGIGLNSDLRGTALEAVMLINASGKPVISADIPSGVEADTGRILGDAVRAEITVTFSMPKAGHFVEPGCEYCGKLVVADIGIPEELLENAGTDTFAVLRDEIFLPERRQISHKGNYGKLLIIGGCEGYSGAPVLCAKASARSGAGLIYLGVPRSIYGITASRVNEPMPFPLAEDTDGKLSEDAYREIADKLKDCNACVIGCGLGRSEELNKLIRRIVRESGKQLIIDADGLFALGSDGDAIRTAAMPPILTPHDGEFARLGGTLSSSRVSDARSFAQDRNCILVLKGHHTICAFPDGEVYINPFGNAGMAKGGSGDVLAGIIGALSVQLPVKQAVITACAVHALAGDRCAESFGEYSMLPTDIIDAIPEITKDIIR